jgi:lysophospholipase L1-like esterase
MPRTLRILLPLVLATALPAASSALPIRVVMMGDSITAGLVAGGGVGYVESLATLLGDGYELTNIACGGLSSLDWTLSAGSPNCGAVPGGIVLPDIYTGRARPELPAEIVTILLGTNDALGFLEPEPVPSAVYGDAIAEIAMNLLADGALHVVLMAPPSLFYSNVVAHQLIVAYGVEVLDVCDSSARIVCGPDLLMLLEQSDFNGTNIHPNAAGNAKIASALFDTITSLSVPEPGTLPLAAAGLVALSLARRSGLSRGSAHRGRSADRRRSRR